MSRGKSILAVLGMLVLALAVCAMQLLTDPVQEEPDPASVVVPMEKDQYNGNGLPGGQTLSGVLVTEVEGKVCYEDRVFRRFSYTEEQVRNFVRAMKGLKALCPDLDYYVVPVPGRVLVEEDYPQDRENYESFIAALADGLGDSAVLLDPWPTLQEHQDEYVFYRTEEGWTARGAYYGSRLLCGQLGIEPFRLSAYDEYMYRVARGNLAMNTVDAYRALYGENEISEMLHDVTDDQFFYYCLPGSVNLEELYDKDTGKMTLQPIISQSRLGSAAFVSDDVLHARLFGDGRSDAVKDKTLLMICDDSGNILAPYMANYYKDVYVVSMQEDEGFLDRLNVLADRYDIDSVVVAQRAFRMGVRAESAAIRDLME